MFLFLRATGYRGFADGKSTYRGHYLYYWSSSVSGSNAWCMNYNAPGNSKPNFNVVARTYGMGVRCIAQ